MGEWKTVFDGEVEERPVAVKIYASEDAELAVRVTTVSMDGYVGPPEQPEDGLMLSAGPEPADAFITLDPAIFSDLEEELTEVGFSPEAAARIVSIVPR
jgi:hypothetical protein